VRRAWGCPGRDTAGSSQLCQPHGWHLRGHGERRENPAARGESEEWGVKEAEVEWLICLCFLRNAINSPPVESVSPVTATSEGCPCPYCHP